MNDFELVSNCPGDAGPTVTPGGIMRAPDGTAYEVHGPGDAPPVVLIHGVGLNRQCWQWSLPALADRYRILTYDFYGHGESPAPPEPPTMSLMSRQVQGLLDHCGIASATIVGFSMGGMIARKFAQDVPERAAALAILHSPHERPQAMQAAVEARVAQARTAGPVSTVENALERWFTADFRRANPAMLALVREWVTANDPAIYHTVYRLLASGVAELVSPDPPIACPVLVMTGDEDVGNGPDMAHAIAADIDGAEIQILKGLRHMALAEQPEAVNRPLLAFLDRVLS